MPPPAPPFPGTTGVCRAAPGSCLSHPQPPLCQPPRRACPLSPHPAVSVCPSVREPVCPSPPARQGCLCPPLPRAPWGTAFSCARPGASLVPPHLCGGHHTMAGWGHPTSSPRRGDGLAPLMGQPLAPPPRGDAGGPRDHCLTQTTSLASPGRGGAGAPSSAAAKLPLPIVCLSFPFFWGGTHTHTRCHCLPSALRPTCPSARPHGGRGPGSGPPRGQRDVPYLCHSTNFI